jgi:hypothetical protein
MDHLGVALGSCLLHFAQHFMARRATPVPCRIAITCAVDQNRCEIQSLDADLALELTLSEEDRGVLLRMLRQCPIHKALDVWTPVNLRVTDQQGA